MPFPPDVLRQVFDFVRESNQIERILRDPTDSEFEATVNFLRVPDVRVIDLQALVAVYQPGAEIRDKVGLDVRVGKHIAPPGGPTIRRDLEILLADAASDEEGPSDPWRVHVAYETLHPFTDGNGRSGRALWAWQMVRRQRGVPLGFLHQFYYQTLERNQ